MEVKLTKTFLSKRLSSNSFLWGIISVAFLTLFFGADPKNFSASAHLVFEEKEYWRLLTTTLLHGDLNHLAHNAFFLIGLTFLVHSYFGFWVFPVLSLVMGALINYITLSYYPPMVQLVGISGVIYFMASFWLTLYMLIERRQKFFSRLTHALGVTLIFLFPQVFSPEVSYLAHGVGFSLGIPLGVTYFLVNFKKIRGHEQWEEIDHGPQEALDIELEEDQFKWIDKNPTSPDGHSL